MLVFEPPPYPPGTTTMTSPSLFQPVLHAKPAGRLRSSLPARRGLPEGDLFCTRLHTGRELRVAANFCETQDEALWLLRHLRADPRLGDEQVQLLKPVDASPRRFLHRRQSWDRLRPLSRRAASTASRATLQLSTLPGLLLCLGLGLLAGLSIVETLGAALLSTFLTLGIGLVLLPWIGNAAQHPRFDQVLQHRLAHGQYAVVVTGVSDLAAASRAIAAMRSVGVYWCAETPGKMH